MTRRLGSARFFFVPFVASAFVALSSFSFSSRRRSPFEALSRKSIESRSLETSPSSSRRFRVSVALREGSFPSRELPFFLGFGGSAIPGTASRHAFSASSAGSACQPLFALLYGSIEAGSESVGAGARSRRWMRTSTGSTPEGDPEPPFPRKRGEPGRDPNAGLPAAAESRRRGETSPPSDRDCDDPPRRARPGDRSRATSRSKASAKSPSKVPERRAPSRNDAPSPPPPPRRVSRGAPDALRSSGPSPGAVGDAFSF
mmetsp:Transcript_7189/g.29777  ORF Transcript_7189/g.29777 Transcript_7189/m.29777 type:complete len:258 (-) Transcript_7189:1278-2051(-)